MRGARLNLLRAAPSTGITAILSLVYCVLYVHVGIVRHVCNAHHIRIAARNSRFVLPFPQVHHAPRYIDRSLLTLPTASTVHHVKHLTCLRHLFLEVYLVGRLLDRLELLFVHL